MATTTRASYGIDAPAAPAGMIVGAIALLGAGVALAVMQRWYAVLPLAGAMFAVCSAVSYYYCTRTGKFAVWQELLDGLELRGDERILDAGCGRGMVLIAAAKRVPNGHVTGVDLWQTKDQSGNQESATVANAKAEGVEDRIELRTADLRELPWTKARFDLVLSAATFHNIKTAEDRATAIREAVRVLKPGGRILIADIAKTADYVRVLHAEGLTEITHRNAGLRYNYGLLTPSRIVTATQPSS